MTNLATVEIGRGRRHEAAFGRGEEILSSASVPTRTLAGFIDDVVRSIDGRFDELVDHVLSTMVATLPGYALVRRPGTVEDMRIGLQVSVRSLLDCICEGRGPTDHELRHFAAIGAQRARQGVDRESVRASVHVAEHVGFGFLLSVVSTTEPAATRFAAVPVLWSTVSDFMSSAATHLLAGFDDVVSRRPTGVQRAHAMLVDRLLRGRWASESEIAADAAGMGLPLRLPARLLLVVAVDGADAGTLYERGTQLSTRLEPCLVGDVVSTPITHMPVLVLDGDDRVDAISDKGHSVEPGVIVVASDRVRSLDALPDLYRRSTDRLEYAVTHTADDGLVPLSHLDLTHVVTGHATPAEQVQFVRDVLGDVLTRADGRELIEILSTLLDSSGLVADIARSVHLHENTVRRRIKKIEQVANVCLDRPADVLKIGVALLLRASIEPKILALGFSRATGGAPVRACCVVGPPRSTRI